jgi:hypothetical protein
LASDRKLPGLPPPTIDLKAFLLPAYRGEARMRLVSNNTDADVERRKVRRNLGFALRKLAANIMRVSRGAGKPYDLGLELARCIDGYQAYHNAHGFYPPEDEIARMLDYERDWPEPVDGPDRREVAWREDMDELELLQRSRDHAERAMQRASLQMVAAMLVGQDLQRRRGQDALEIAIRRHKDADREINLYWAAKSAAERLGKLAKRPKATLAPAAKRVVPLPAPEPATPPAARRAAPAPQPPPPKADPFQPPPYRHLKQAPLTDAIREEFGVVTALDLVHRLNALWREEERRPLPQGNFPEKEASLQWVVKELRRAQARAAERARASGGA